MCSVLRQRALRGGAVSGALAAGSFVNRERRWMCRAEGAGAGSAAGPAPRSGARIVRHRAGAYPVEEKTIGQLSTDLASGAVTSRELVRAYQHRVAALDRSGPALRSVLSLNAAALADAERLDEERARGALRGPLHGVPLLVKDNIETAEALATTAGSLALAGNVTRRDAPAVERLRAAGAIVLGKTNLSEWANFRSSRASSGWSALGGQTRNPYCLDRSPNGSSSGSGAAVAASLAAGALGTETDGSAVLPAACCGLVAIKPTVGLVSRRHVVPISDRQDTIAPMAKTVADVACLLDCIAGTDKLDPATWPAEIPESGYSALLDAGALRGARLGVARFLPPGPGSPVQGPFEEALAALRRAGAVLVELPEDSVPPRVGACEWQALQTEFKHGVEKYLSEASSDVQHKTLADLIAFNEAELEREMRYCGQELFLASQNAAAVDDQGYVDARAEACRLAGPETIDRWLLAHSLDALVAPTATPACTIDLVNGDGHSFQGSACQLPAVAGYPHVTVPMGQIHGLPVGLSLIGTAWSEGRLLALAHAYEQHANARRPPTYMASVPLP